MYHQFKELAEVDITTDAMEVGPTLHYFMGGIRVDNDSQMTKVPGLFACGECAGGMHGANRLGGNSLSDLLVFGWLAGKGAASYVNGLESAPQLNPESVHAARKQAIAPLNRESGDNPYLVHEGLQDIMHEGCNIIREGKGIGEAVERLQGIKERIANVRSPGASQYNPGWHEALALNSMIIVAEAVARAAHMREESRGAHTRLDFQGEHAEWSTVNLVIRKGTNGEMEIEKVERGDPDPELAGIARSTLEDLEGGIHV